MFKWTLLTGLYSAYIVSTLTSLLFLYNAGRKVFDTFLLSKSDPSFILDVIVFILLYGISLILSSVIDDAKENYKFSNVGRTPINTRKVPGYPKD